MLNSRSMYSKMATIISSSFLGAALERKSTELHTPPAASTVDGRGGDSLVLGVGAGVDDPVHVQVQVIKLHLVGVGLAGVHRDTDAIALLGLEDERVLIQPVLNATVLNTTSTEHNQY